MASQPDRREFKNDEDRALRGSDEDIYEKLKIDNHARHENESELENVCNSIGFPAQGPASGFEARPNTLPFLRKHVLALHNELGTPDLKGCWSVPWAHRGQYTNPLENPYQDGFRGVFQFRSIEFMIRPIVPLNRDADDPVRVRIGWQDIRECLRVALDANQDPHMTVRIGCGQMKHPHKIRHPRSSKPNINFEWRVDRGVEERVASQVMQWRYDACKGGAKAYHDKKEAADKQRALEEYYEKRVAAEDPGVQEPLWRPHIPSTQPQETQHYPKARGAYRSHKRSSRPSEDAEAGPSSKRRSIGSQSDIPASPAAVAVPAGAGQYHPPAALGQPSMMTPGLWSIRSGQGLEKFPTPISATSPGTASGQTPGGSQYGRGQQQQQQPHPLAFTQGQPGVFPQGLPQRPIVPQHNLPPEEVQRNFQVAMDTEIKAAQEQQQLEQSMAQLGRGRGGPPPPPSQTLPTGPVQAGRGGGGAPLGPSFPRGGGPMSGPQSAQGGRGRGNPPTTNPQGPPTGPGARRGAGQAGGPPSGPSSPRGGGNQSGHRRQQSGHRGKHSGRRGQDRGARGSGRG